MITTRAPDGANKARQIVENVNRDFAKKNCQHWSLLGFHQEKFFEILILKILAYDVLFIVETNKTGKTSNPAPHFMCFDLQKGKVELLPPICRVAHQHTALHQDHGLHPSHIVRLSQAQVVKQLGGAHVFQDSGWARVFHSRWDIICIHPRANIKIWRWNLKG